MTPDPSQILCVKCGMCCDGTLFDDIQLQNQAEADDMEVLGLQLDEDTDDIPTMLVPCVGLKNCRCTVYRHRPVTCRTFECRVLIEVGLGDIEIEEAQSLIQSARKDRKADWIKERFLGTED